MLTPDRATHGRYDWDHPFSRSADDSTPLCCGGTRAARVEKVLEFVTVPRPVIWYRLGVELGAESEPGGNRATEHVMHLSRVWRPSSVGRDPPRPPGVAPSVRGLK